MNNPWLGQILIKNRAVGQGAMKLETNGEPVDKGLLTFNDRLGSRGRKDERYQSVEPRPNYLPSRSITRVRAVSLHNPQTLEKTDAVT